MMILKNSVAAANVEALPLPRVVNVRVRCEGRWHVVTVHPRRRTLTLPHHPNAEVERMAARLAQEALPLCLLIEKAWATWDRGVSAAPVNIVWPIGNLHEGFMPWTSVSCQGSLHRIVVGANGQIGFPDHDGDPGHALPDVRRLLQALSGERREYTNRCLMILQHYRAACGTADLERAQHFVHLPDLLKDAARRAWR